MSVVQYPECRFAVICDPHVYAPSLGASGAAFERFLKHSPNTPAESLGLLQRAVADILKTDAAFVLICGDLTNYGEAESHRAAAAALEVLRQAGKEVYLVPGNHDINDGIAYTYRNGVRRHTPTVSTAGFLEIYRPFGYETALSRDPASLSYVAEPFPGLWLLAMDTCRYRENRWEREPVVGGRVSPHSWPWVERVLRQAKKERKVVVWMSHHGVVEHWRGQKRLHKEYLVDRFEAVSKYLLARGVRLAFTGHDHASDIAVYRLNDRKLYDISGGSLAAAANTYRLCTLKKDLLKVETVSLMETFLPERDYAKRAQDAFRRTVYRLAYEKCRAFHVSPKDADYLASVLAVLYLAHSIGDEDPRQLPQIDPTRLGFMGRLAYASQRYAFENLPKNPPPPDNRADLRIF